MVQMFRYNCLILGRTVGMKSQLLNHLIDKRISREQSIILILVDSLYKTSRAETSWPLFTRYVHQYFLLVSSLKWNHSFPEIAMSYGLSMQLSFWVTITEIRCSGDLLIIGANLIIHNRYLVWKTWVKTDIADIWMFNFLTRSYQR